MATHEFIFRVTISGDREGDPNTILQIINEALPGAAVRLENHRCAILASELTDEDLSAILSASPAPECPESDDTG